MSETDPNSKRYIEIARACLRAINRTVEESGDQSDRVQAVYDAIDKAFQEEFSQYREQVMVMQSVLERIGSGQLDAQQAADLAQKTLNMAANPETGASMH